MSMQMLSFCQGHDMNVLMVINDGKRKMTNYFQQKLLLTKFLQERCIIDGTLTVNYDQVDVDYRLRHNDLLANIVHR